MWLKSMVDDVIYVPRAERISIDLDVRCRIHGARARVVLKNLTTEGARIEAVEGLRYDDVITLMLPSLKPKDAYVVWVKGQSAGIAFERPLHPNVFATLARKHGTPCEPGALGDPHYPAEPRPTMPLHQAA